MAQYNANLNQDAGGIHTPAEFNTDENIWEMNVSGKDLIEMKNSLEELVVRLENTLTVQDADAKAELEAMKAKLEAIENKLNEQTYENGAALTKLTGSKVGMSFNPRPAGEEGEEYYEYDVETEEVKKYMYIGGDWRYQPMASGGGNYDQAIQALQDQIDQFVKIEVLEDDPVDPKPNVLYLIVNDDNEGIPVPDYFFRFDAMELELNNNNSVSIWPDMSANGNDLVQSVTADQPTFLEAGLNGKPTVQFANSHLINDSFALDNVNGATMFIVMEVDDPSSSSAIATILDFNEQDFQFYFRFSSNDQDAIININGVRTSYAPLISDSAVLYAVTYDTSVAKMYSNGSHIRDSSAVSGPIGAHDMLALGGRPRPGNTPNIPYQGRISEYIHFSRVLSEQELNNMSTYLMDKWGI